MRKTVLAVSLAFLAGMLGTYCGGGGGGIPSDPAAAKEAFNNPSGTVSDANAQDVAEGALLAGNASALQGMFGSLPLPRVDLGRIALNRALDRFHSKIRVQTIDGCFSFSDDGTEITIDMECLMPLASEGECTGSGTLTVTGDESGAAEFSFNNISITCGDDLTLTNLSGTGYADSEIICLDVSVTMDGETESYAGCAGITGGPYDGQVLYYVDGESYVVVGWHVGTDCADVCVDVTDSTGSVHVSCPVTAPAGGCESVEDIETLGTCTYGTGLCS